ncbi:hypothetical protein ACPXCX_54990, partial [Streptomyces sp. DT225]
SAGPAGGRRELSKGAYQEHDPHPLQRAPDHLWAWFSDVLSAASVAAPVGHGGPARCRPGGRVPVAAGPP